MALQNPIRPTSFSSQASRARLGDILLRRGLLTTDQLNVALREQGQTRELLGEILVRMGFITRTALAETLGEQAGSERVEVRELTIPQEVLGVVPETLAKKLKVIPLNLKHGLLTIGMVDAFDVMAFDHLASLTGMEIEVKAITEEDYFYLFDTLYGGFQETEAGIEETIKAALQVNLAEGGGEPLLEGPIIRLVNFLILKAVRQNATDIHLEPEEKVFRSRYRVDGVLIQGPSIPSDLQLAIVSRIKIMSGMNIAETRLPQDGRITFKIGSRDIDLRVSTFPTVYGENVVIRVLDKERVAFGLEKLGFAEKQFKVFKDLIERPNGIILVTGPTGSGKTTTLYSALLELNSIDKNIMTLEDPVEYYLPMIRQCQVNPKAGLTFATGLRSLMRQDPDVLLVGEVRDLETAEMAIRSALTGHLVFSTLHTNDSPGAISRLVDMGVPAFLINSCLLAAMAQRLVRIICPKCRRPHSPTEAEVEEIGVEKTLGMTFFKGVGCSECNYTGYKGRLAIFELLTMSKEIQRLIMEGASSATIRETARREGMETMREDGLNKIRQGITTLEEVLRVTAE